MSFFSFPPIIISIAAIVLGLFVLRENVRSKANLGFFTCSLSVFIWLFAYGIAFSTNNPIRALYWVKIGYIGVILIPSSFYHFTIGFLKLKNRHTLSLLYFVSFIFIALLLSPQLLISGVKNYFWGYYPIAGKLHPVFLAFFIFTYLLCVSHLFFSHKNSALSPQESIKLRYVFWAFFMPTFACIDYAAHYGISIYPLGYLFIASWLSTVTYAILKYNLMDIRVAFTSAGLFIFIYSIVLGIPCYLWYNYPNSILPITLMFVFSTSGPLIYRFLQKKAENMLLAQQKRYQNILLQASKGMVKQHELGKLLKLIVYIISKNVKISFAAAYLHNKENNKYELQIVRESEPSDIITSFGMEHPFIQYIVSMRYPFTYEELPQNIKDPIASEPGALIVPSFADKKLIGFIVLGKKLNKAVYSQEDINVFKTLSNQMALAIENCMHIIESNETRERLFAAEKLASIGGMAEGISHQIMNRMGHFIMNSELIKKKVSAFNNIACADGKKTEASDEMVNDVTRLSDSILDSTCNMADMLRGVLNFAKIEVTEKDYSTFHLNEIVNPALELLRVKHHPERIPLVIEINKDGGLLYGLKSHLMEALYNIFDNAFEATKEKKEYLKNNRVENSCGYVPAIKIRLYDDKDKVTIEVSDNGIGIKDENKRKIFAPFYSTKSTNKSGSGIGMYTVKRMIEETLKGKVCFESTYLSGTTISLHLPLNQK